MERDFMPIYEFKCETCSHIDEVLMKINDPAPEKCSECGAKVHKIMSQTSFSLKGTGWYVTDYKNQGQSKETKEPLENKEVKGQEASPETKESKPAEIKPAAETSSSETA
jgi:putative FmdB family regulatory protein